MVRLAAILELKIQLSERLVEIFFKVDVPSIERRA